MHAFSSERAREKGLCLSKSWEGKSHRYVEHGKADGTILCAGVEATGGSCTDTEDWSLDKAM